MNVPNNSLGSSSTLLTPEIGYDCKPLLSISAHPYFFVPSMQQRGFKRCTKDLVEFTAVNVTSPTIQKTHLRDSSIPSASQMSDCGWIIGGLPGKRPCGGFCFFRFRCPPAMET